MSLSIRFIMVANIKEQDTTTNSVICRNWDVASFEEYPDEKQMEEAIKHIVLQPQQGIRYIKIEKRYFQQ